MKKDSSSPEKFCPICKAEMKQELISESDGYRQIKYTCPKNNCPRYHNSLVESVKVNNSEIETLK